MTREEAKKLLPVIQAYSEGKIIQRYRYDSKEWYDVPAYMKLDFKDKPEHLRIKPEPKFRPFKSAKECWDEMLKHQPFGWVRIKHSSEYKHVAYIKEKGVALSDLVNTDKTASASYDGALRWLLFTDGTSFGINEEED